MKIQKFECRLLKIKDLSIKKSKAQIYRLIDEGKIIAFRFGKSIRITALESEFFEKIANNVQDVRFV